MADNSNTLQLILQVKDDGSVVIGQVVGKIKGLGDATEAAAGQSSKSLLNLGKNWIDTAAKITAGYLSIKTASDIIKSSISNAAEAQQIESRMAFQIETVGLRYEKVKVAVDAYAMSVMNSTRFSDEAARQGLGQMMQYTDNLEGAMKNLKLAMDMSTQTGQDLDSTIRYVGMAMSGNVEILGRWIPELRDLDGKLGANATAAERWAYTQDILNKKFSGAAIKDLQTYSGAVAKLKNEWDEIKETLGAKLLGVFENYLWFINHVTGADEKRYETARKLKEEMAKVAEEQNRAAMEKRGYEEITKYASALDEATYGYKILGMESTAVYTDQVSKAQWAVEKIKVAWQQGKSTALDYYNALKTASDLMKKGMGDQGDQTKQLVDLQIDLSEKIKEVSWEDPDRTKKINKLIDDWITARGKILEASKTPIQILADISPMEREFEKGKASYAQYKAEIEGNPIRIKVENFLPGGGGGGTTPSLVPGAPGNFYSSNVGLVTGAFADQNLNVKLKYLGADGKEYSSLSEANSAGFSGASPIKWASDVNANVNFTATGLSPKIPLGDAFRKITANFKTMQEKTQAMEATIEFAEISDQLKSLQKKYDLYEGIAQEWKRRSKLLDTEQNWMVKEARGFQEEIRSQMAIPKMKLAQQKYMLGFPGAEEEFYNLFQSQYGFPAYQHGASYVPRTGPAIVHQGEKIVPANQNFSMGGINLNFTINGGGRQAADEIAHVLKYELSASLRDAIKRIK